MSRDQDPDEQPIHSEHQLVDWFQQGCKGDATLGVGTEHEKPGFDGTTLRPLAYEGPDGIGALLAALASTFGWEPTFDAGGQITALLRDGAAVTLEPGGQLELSGRVTRTIFETRDELTRHLDEIAELAPRFGQRWTHMGINPWDDPADIPWMPKSRYRVMRDWLGRRGALAHWMMKATCTVQANFDYRDERDAMRKLRLASRLSPLVTALFATTPVRAARPQPFVSTRMEIWEQTDPDRTGTPPSYLEDDARFGDIVQWALDVPMLFIVREGRYVDLTGRTFRAFVEDGALGQRATLGDWVLHVSTLFPDVRLKRYIEVRTADAGPPGHLLALPALWKGVLYDDVARAEAEQLVPFAHAELLAVAAGAARDGYAAATPVGRLEDLCLNLVGIAARGLDRQAGSGPSERVFLEPLREGARVRDASAAFRTLWGRTGGDRGAVIEATSLRSSGG